MGCWGSTELITDIIAEEKLKEKADEVSGGQRQRCARAIVVSILHTVLFQFRFDEQKVKKSLSFLEKTDI